MRGGILYRTTQHTRGGAGSHLADFGAALVLLAGFVLVPLLDLTIVPIRWMLAQELVNNYARKLSLCETFTGARQLMDADPSLRDRLLQLGGITVESINLHLRINRIFRYQHSEETLLAESPREIPDAWLPIGSQSPCSYILEIDVKSLMSPAILLPLKGISVPGLTKPIPFLISSSHEFSNCGPDPNTGRFFISE